MLQGHTTAIVPCGNPTPKKLPTGGGEWPTFRTARAQRAVRPLCAHCTIRSIQSTKSKIAKTISHGFWYVGIMNVPCS